MDAPDGSRRAFRRRHWRARRVTQARLATGRATHGPGFLAAGLPASLLTAALLVGCGGEPGHERTQAALPDFARLTPHPELYVRSRPIPERVLEGPAGCAMRGSLPGGAADGRWLNYLTDEQLADPGPPVWVPEAAEDPAESGTYEVTAHPCRRPTAEEVRAAQDLWDRSLQAAVSRGWFDVAKAEADGFHIGHPGERIHYVHDEHMVDDGVLVPERPEFLVVFEAKTGERLLAGFMYMLPDVRARGPQIGGPLTVWHYHIMDLHCWRDGLVVARPDAAGRCATGVPSRRTPEMLHVWFFDRKHGPFASDMKPPKGMRTGPSATCHGLPVGDGSDACRDVPAR